MMWKIMHGSVWVAFSRMSTIHPITIWVVGIVEVGIGEVLSAKVIIMDESKSNVCIVISVVSAVVVPISPVVSIEVVSSEIKWV
jgi:hypothetical protein